MKRIKNFAIGAAGLFFLMVLGSVLHVPQWVAKAAAVYASPVSNVIDAYSVPYQSEQVVQPCGLLTCTAYFPAAPNGYEFILKQISVEGAAPGSGSVQIDAFLSTYSTRVFSQSTPTFGSNNEFATTTAVTGFSVAGAKPSVSITGPAIFTQNASVTLTGVLVNCGSLPGGVCPAITD